MNEIAQPRPDQPKTTPDTRAPNTPPDGRPAPPSAGDSTGKVLADRDDAAKAPDAHRPGTGTETARFREAYLASQKPAAEAASAHRESDRVSARSDHVNVAVAGPRHGDTSGIHGHQATDPAAPTHLHADTADPKVRAKEIEPPRKAGGQTLDTPGARMILAADESQEAAKASINQNFEASGLSSLFPREKMQQPDRVGPVEPAKFSDDQLRKIWARIEPDLGRDDKWFHDTYRYTKQEVVDAFRGVLARGRQHDSRPADPSPQRPYEVRPMGKEQAEDAHQQDVHRMQEEYRAKNPNVYDAVRGDLGRLGRAMNPSGMPGPLAAGVAEIYMAFGDDLATAFRKAELVAAVASLAPVAGRGQASRTVELPPPGRSNSAEGRIGVARGRAPSGAAADVAHEASRPGTTPDTKAPSTPSDARPVPPSAGDITGKGRTDQGDVGRAVDTERARTDRAAPHAEAKGNARLDQHPPLNAPDGAIELDRGARHPGAAREPHARALEETGTAPRLDTRDQPFAQRVTPGARGEPSARQDLTGTDRRTGMAFHERNAAEIVNNLRIEYDPAAGRPVKVSYDVDANKLAAPSASDRSFARDWSTQGPQGTNAAYAGSGYDRGHLVQREAFKGSIETERAADLQTQIVPMTPELNRGKGSPWRAAERATGDLARQHGSVRVEVEPVYNSDPPRLRDGTPIPDTINRRVYAPDGTLLRHESFDNRRVAGGAPATE